MIYASPLVDVAANMDLVRETIEACKLILENTNWQIRLLSKSNLLPKIAQAIAELDPIPKWSDDFSKFGFPPGKIVTAKERMIFGVSTGTFNDGLAKVFEQGCPLPSKRLESLYWLQDHGFRTFGMI